MTLNHYYMETLDKIKQACSKLAETRQQGGQAWTDAQAKVLADHGQTTYVSATVA